MSKTIFITGASRGFGRIWTEAFLKRGDKVAATARDLNALKDLAKQYGDNLLPIKLDVTNHKDCFATVKKAQEHFGIIVIHCLNMPGGFIKDSLSTALSCREIPCRNSMNCSTIILRKVL